MKGQRKNGAGLRYIKRRLVFALALVALVLLGCWLMRGRVISVVDGDTLEVLTVTGGLERVRLYGIDCPELGQPFGPEAKDYASSLALYGDVRLDSMDIDQYGRNVAVVTLADGTVLNETLLAAGYAMVYERFCKVPKCDSWRQLEKNAREQKLGLWSVKNPEKPWNWRRRQNKGKQ